MTRLRAPFDGPVWLPELVRSIEQAFRDAASNPAPVTATGTGASQDITLPEPLTADDVLVFVSGALVTSYTVSGRTLTLTAAASAPIVILKR